MRLKHKVITGLTALAAAAMAACPAFAQSAESETVSETQPVAEIVETTEAVDYDPLTPAGSLTLVDDVRKENGKQFITMVSKNGNYFYLVIDRDKDGNENVHFLNLVDEADLLALMEEEDAEKYLSEKETEPAVIEVPETVPSQETETPSEPEPEKKPKIDLSKINKKQLTAAAIGGLIALGGSLAAFLKKRSTKTKAVEAQKDPDADYIETDEPDDYGSYEEKEEEL